MVFLAWYGAIRVASGRPCAGTKRSTQRSGAIIGYRGSPELMTSDGRTSGKAQWGIAFCCLEKRRCGGSRGYVDTGVLAKVVLLLSLKLLFAPALAATAQDVSYRVLVLHSYRNNLPVNTDWTNGIVRGLDSAPDLRFEIDIETPDLARFDDTAYMSDLVRIYRHKYRGQTPHLIIPTHTPALRFLLEHGDDLFPGAAIVFCGADPRLVANRKLPPHVTGVTAHLDFAGTLKLALAVNRDSRRVAVIVGSSALDTLFYRDAREAFQPFEGQIEFTWLRGMPRAELIEAVGKLPPQTVLLYLVQLEDRTGQTHVPVETVQALSAVAHAPIYGLWDTLLGHGIIGGRLATLADDGFQTAQMGVRILRGQAPAAMPVVNRERNDAIFHGGELARWHIAEDLLPSDSQILYRELTLWDEHRTAIQTTVLIIGLQSFLILALLLNRKRLSHARAALQHECDLRRESEATVSKMQTRLEQFNKERALGAMATGIAHEINQPLMAIQNYAHAARLRLERDGDQIPKLNELLAKVEQQAGRAGEVIRHIRNLFSTDAPELNSVALCSLIDTVIEVLEQDIEHHGCGIDCRMTGLLPPVRADELQIQLVLVNLLRNAMQSMDAVEDRSERGVGIEVRQINDREVQVGVSDRGPGIPAGQAERLFEPFLSGSAGGMGIGLATCRMIIQSHGGRIWCTPGQSGGVVFRFTLQLADT